MMTLKYEDIARMRERERVAGRLRQGPSESAVLLRWRQLPRSRACDRRPHGRRTMSAAATVVHVTYCDEVVEKGIDAWPSIGFALLDELERARGRVALIVAPANADRLVERLRTDLGVDVVRVGQALAHGPQPPSLTDVESACGDATVITDLEVLLWPQMDIALLPLLAARGRRRPTIAVWPGHIVTNRARYSAPGRPDHHDVPLHDAVVLRPRDTRFPDEVPFTIERILP